MKFVQEFFRINMIFEIQILYNDDSFNLNKILTFARYIYKNL